MADQSRILLDPGSFSLRLGCLSDYAAAQLIRPRARRLIIILFASGSECTGGRLRLYRPVCRVQTARSPVLAATLLHPARQSRWTFPLQRARCGQWRRDLRRAPLNLPRPIFHSLQALITAVNTLAMMHLTGVARAQVA